MSSEFAKREPGNQEERSSAPQQARSTTTAGLNGLTATIPRSVFWWIIVMMVSFSWKTAVTIRPHAHWRTNHTAISSQEATRSSGTTTCVRLARVLVQLGVVCAFAVLNRRSPGILRQKHPALGQTSNASASLPSWERSWSGSRHLWRSGTGRSDQRDDNDQAKPCDHGFGRR